MASAQGPVTITAAPAGNSATVDLSGTPAYDLITLGALGPGAPLRYGNVVPGSEVVQLNGFTLQANTDYMMDYAVGVVYLKVSQKAGQTLGVTYRYKAGPVVSGPTGSQLAGLTPYKFTLAPGALNMLAGFGMAERGEDGSVMSSNLFGLNNTFKLGQGSSLSGLYMIGDRTRENNVSGFSTGNTNTQSSIRAGSSQLVLQNSVLVTRRLGEYRLSGCRQELQRLQLLDGSRSRSRKPAKGRERP